MLFVRVPPHRPLPCLLAQLNPTHRCAVVAVRLGPRVRTRRHHRLRRRGTDGSGRGDRERSGGFLHASLAELWKKASAVGEEMRFCGAYHPLDTMMWDKQNKHNELCLLSSYCLYPCPIILLVMPCRRKKEHGCALRFPGSVESAMDGDETAA